MTILVSPQLKAHLALHKQTRAMLWRCERKDHVVIGFTNLDQDIIFQGVTYEASSGFSRSDIQTAAALEVDTGEAIGFLRSPAITESDLAAGVWDFCQIKISTVNYKDLSQGELIYRVGTIGEVTLERGRFKAEWRGKTQAYTRVIGELTSPSCRAVLGDARCKVDLVGGSPSLTVTGTVTGVGADNRTVYDTSRTEPGRSAGIAIVGITQANPGVVTIASALGLPSGSPITISGVIGMEEVNTNTTAENVASDGLSFELPADTTSYGAYVSSGTVIGMGSGSGFFDNGVLTWTGPSGNLNIGERMEVQSYEPGQIILELPMYYQIQVGDTYSMHAGCDYSFQTCRDRFDNVLNFRGEPYVKGVDKLIQVGRAVG